MADINIYGTFNSRTGDGVVARAEQIYDQAEGKFQSELNQEFKNGKNVEFEVQDETLIISY